MILNGKSLFKYSIFSSLFAFIILAMPTNAQWYQAKGTAQIKYGDKQAAREKATQQALKKALLVAGASVTSVQQITNGLLTQDDFAIRASGDINSVQIISESEQDDIISVTVRADIIPQQKACFSADYKKALLLTRSELLHRSQANIGQIYALDKVVIDTLAEQLANNSRYIKLNKANQQKTQFSKLNNDLQQQAIKQMTMSLAQQTDSQFVLFSEITDVSFDNEIKNNWQFWQQDQFERNFAFSLYVFNGLNGEPVYQKHYQTKALWPFKKREVLDVNSQTFWHSDYGMSIKEVMEQAALDLDQQLMCQATRAQILQVNGNQVLLNLGKSQGVKIGDEFSLVHLQNFISDLGNTYAGYNVSDYKVKVISVTEQSAIAKSLDDRLLGNIQRDDLAVKY